MRIGIPREIVPGENRVAATPTTVAAIRKLGYDIAVEHHAGDNASLPDDAYEKAGATLADSTTVWGSSIVLAVNEPSDEQIGLMQRGAILVTFLHPRQDLELTQKLQAAGITGMSMDMVPRISRAQSMDALSSMANISGYRAVVEAAHAYGRTFGGQVTAAGKDDVIITTAAIPGKPSPKLITADMVAAMKPGSVIVDLAALGGGNCELTRPGEKYVTDNGVTIIGYIDLPSRLAGQSSQLYGTNLVNLLKLVTPDKDGQIVLDMDDEVVRTMTVCKDGELLYPPPPVQVAAAPKPAAKAPEPVEEVKKEPRPWTYSFGIVTALAVVLIALLTFAPASFVELFGTFAIAVVVGYYVVWNVTHALHTPLMSVTNAISGIIIVGAITQLGSGSWAIKIIAAITVLIASINIFGGFTVTQRMLKMFRKA